ncbi:MAG: trypsin-like peptidase domain-containing protein [Rhodospirillales bacterium]
MRLEDQYLRCVVWIGTGLVGSEDEITPWGTGFFVNDDKNDRTYLVTAAHVVSDNSDAPFQIRFNEKGGGGRNHTVDQPNWVFHPSDVTVDVAIHEVAIPSWADVVAVTKHPNLTEGDRLQKKRIGPGTRTYTVGVWKFLYGKKRNQPFVYTGHIGLMPGDERLPVDPWRSEHGKERVFVEAYLVEGEPLDGASGAPVFARRTIKTPIGKGGKVKEGIDAYIEGSIWLLGLQSDCFIGKPGEDYVAPGAGGRVMIPRGVNVVVPLEKILEVFGE